MTVSVMAGDSETTVTDCDVTHHQLKGRQVTEMVSVLHTLVNQSVEFSAVIFICLLLR